MQILNKEERIRGRKKNRIINYNWKLKLVLSGESEPKSFNEKR